MDSIICKCGNNVQLDYSTAAIDYVNEGASQVYVLRCNRCGQTYSKPVPEPIQINE
jgi:hypothetical protein